MRTGWDATMADIVLINPKFEISFSGSEHAMALLGKRAFMPVAALPLLASITPPEHRVTLVDENVEPIDFDRCSGADIVGITGMVVQRRRMREIITELKRRGVKLNGVIGTWDVLSVEAIAFRDRCSEQGIEGEWLEWEGQMHCFPLVFPYGFEESTESVDWIVRTLSQ